MRYGAAAEMPPGDIGSTAITTAIPFRLDRLPWSRWHWLVVSALGITWILDGLEVTIIGAVGPQLTKPQTLHLSDAQVAAAGSFYILGAVGGALFFGYLTDRLGRKRLFTWTLVVYALGTVLTAIGAVNAWSLWLFRVITGMGIGGEYSAINSAIDELIPARHRGFVDLAINGSWWLGTAVGSALTVVLLDPRVLPVQIGWRVAFGLGVILVVAVLAIRRILPESPRWLMTHGKIADAEQIVAEIERIIVEEHGGIRLDQPGREKTLTIIARERPYGLAALIQTLVRTYPERSALGFSLMFTQAFLYNAIFFTYGLVLSKFFGVAAESVGLYLLPFAAGNLAGPLLLGRFFDTLGRRTMIGGCYLLAAVLLAITGTLFVYGLLDARTITAAWTVIFFFASAAASAAYLTVSEIFPLEIRALSIAVFYSIATGAGGAGAPVLFGLLITGTRSSVYAGYVLGAVLMALGGLAALRWGVAAERTPLEDVARPLSAVAE